GRVRRAVFPSGLPPTESRGRASVPPALAQGPWRRGRDLPAGWGKTGVGTVSGRGSAARGTGAERLSVPGHIIRLKGSQSCRPARGRGSRRPAAKHEEGDGGWRPRCPTRGGNAHVRGDESHCREARI